MTGTAAGDMIMTTAGGTTDRIAVTTGGAVTTTEIETDRDRDHRRWDDDDEQEVAPLPQRQFIPPEYI